MNTNNLLLLGALGIGAYFIFSNKNNSSVIYAGGGSSPSPAPLIITTPNPTPATSTPATTTTTRTASSSSGSSSGGRSQRNNTYDRTSGVLIAGGQGYSVAPENVGRQIVNATTQQAQSVYTRINVNPYARL